MFDIHHIFEINSPIKQVYKGISEPEFIDKWWSLKCEGKPHKGEAYQLHFGEGYDWEATVIAAEEPNKFGFKLTQADSDWMETLLHFELAAMNPGKTLVRFHHSGWPEDNDHRRISSYCWAMYLRILKRYLEFGEEVPYEERLNV